LGVVVPSLLGVGPLALTFAQVSDHEEELGVQIVLGADQAEALGVAGIGFGHAPGGELGFTEEVECERVVGVGRDRIFVGRDCALVILRGVGSDALLELGVVGVRALGLGVDLGGRWCGRRP